METVNLCPKCGVRPIDEHMGNLCFECSADASKALFKAYQAGGKALEQPAPEVVGEQIIPFDMAKPQPEAKPKWCGCEVIFRYNNGAAMAVRLTAMEQKQIADRILSNRRTGRRDLQGVLVCVFSREMGEVMIKCVEAIANPTSVQDPGPVMAEAKELLEALKA